MKILLINPEKLIVPPFGLLYVGSMLRTKGHDVVLKEAPFGITAEERRRFIESAVSTFMPDLIGLTCMSMQARIAKDIVSHLRRRFPEIPVVAGGVHPTIDPGDALDWGADIAVRGEGEKTILEIAEYLSGLRDISSINGISYKDGGALRANPDRELIKDLNELPPLSYDLLEDSRMRQRSYNIRGFWLRCGWVMTARGCPARCIFCASKTMHGRVVREFAVERILDELDLFKKRYGIEGLWILDDSFSMREKRVVEFCRGLKERKIDIIWGCQARVDTFTDKMAGAMKTAGCVQVDFGVESGSQKILDYLKKGIKCEETKRAFKIARANGLRAGATVIVGSPTETREDIQMTYDLLDELKPDFMAPFFLTPFPGTELYDIAKEKKWIDLSGEIDWQSTADPIMTLDMPSSEIKKAYERLLGYGRSTVFEYLRQPRFLFDLSRVLASHPGYILRLAGYAARLKKRDMMNLFLYIFRKEMLRK